LYELVRTANLPTSVIATANGFLFIRKARHMLLKTGNSSASKMYKAAELYATIHLPLEDIVRPNDSGKAEDEALMDTSSTTLVWHGGCPEDCSIGEGDWV